MKFFASAAALVALIPTVLGLTVNTPTGVVECEPIQFTWSDGTPPYYLSLVPGGQASGAALEQFGEQQGTSYTWTVALQANTQFTVALKDSTGSAAYSDIVTIQSGSDTSCTTATGSATSGGSSATGSSSGSGSGTTTSGGSSASGASSSGSSASNTASASSSSSSSAGSRGSTVGTFGVAGVLGLVGAALF